MTKTEEPEVEILRREVAFSGYFKVERLTVRHRRHDGEWTAPYTREVFERGQAVAVLPYDPDADRVILIEQLRPPIMLAGVPPRQIEIVAGIIETGETLEEVALRELHEEAGLTAQSLHRLVRILPSPGACSETITIYLALVDGSEAGGHFGLAEEHEEIRVLALPAAEAFRLAGSGAVENATALTALQWLQLHHAEVRSRRGLPPPVVSR